MPRSRTACSSAAWSTTSPRAVLMKYEPGFSRSSTDAFTSPLRVGVEREMDAQHVAALGDLGR